MTASCISFRRYMSSNNTVGFVMLTEQILQQLHLVSCAINLLDVTVVVALSLLLASMCFALCLIVVERFYSTFCTSSLHSARLPSVRCLWVILCNLLLCSVNILSLNEYQWNAHCSFFSTVFFSWFSSEIHVVEEKENENFVLYTYVWFFYTRSLNLWLFD